MVVRSCFTVATALVVLALLGDPEVVTAERWSRQVSNSEWIPLASPRTASAQVSQGNAPGGLLHSGAHLSGQVQTLALPPVLQHQYQEQLMQLQKTQESIQKLLLLQQQLKTQQQILQSQAYLPNSYSNAGEDEKQALPQSSLGSLQTAPELAPELLVPPSSEALPPIYPPQDFVPERPVQLHQSSHHGQSLRGDQELSTLPIQGQVVLQRVKGANVEDAQGDSHVYLTKQNGQRPVGKRLKGQPTSELQHPSSIESVGDEEEEVQLVYVPAETLAQRGQPKRGRGRKPYFARQPHQQRENQGNIEQTSLSPDQEAFARQVLQQIQKEHEEKAQFLKEERVKEFARLNEEQKALERKTRLQQEAMQREQELLRQKEAEKKRKELERLEEMARQRELDRIREAREKQRQEELERRRLAELRAKEEKRREDESRQREDRQKQHLELERTLKHQRFLEGQPEDQLRIGGPVLLHQNLQSQSFIQEQAHRQHLTDGGRSKKIRGRQRPQINQYQDQTNYREVTTPLPNQPPLSVYMGSSTSKLETVRVTDVLRILRDAKTIAVLDNVGPNSPQVFVGPSNLDPPYGYAKFDLPYLSSLDHNRVERKVDKLPFFVAPLSFDPPPGYSKIPFPAPHIGSVVVNTLAETSSEPDTPTRNQNSGSTPLIELNSYSDVDQSGSIATTASYESPTTQKVPAESSGPKYESSYSTPPSSSRFRFRQFYDNKPTAVVGTSYYGEQSTARTKSKQYYEQDSKLTTQLPKVETTVSYRQEVPYSNTPSSPGRTAGSSHDPSTKEQDLAAQLALISQELGQQREGQKYNTDERYYSQANVGESYDANDVQAPVGPTQYNLPPELPPISPHLPGLVNSLLDKQEQNIASTPPSTTTPGTTTAPLSSTTYRPRGRGRIVPTRPRTTQAPGGRTSADRIRRPYNRSKSRFTTTTEDYHETTYAPTKAKITTETTQRYSTVEYRRPTPSRTHKYRSRDRTSSQSTIPEQNQSVQVHQAAGYESYPQNDSQGSASPDAYSPTSRPVSNPHQKETASSGASDFTRENYPPTTPVQTENYPPLREVTVQHSPAPLVSNDYSRSQNYPQNRPQNERYHGTTYDQGGDFESPTLEKAPVNGFNYQVGNEESSDRTTHPKLKYPRYQEKSENSDYTLASTQDPRIGLGEEDPRYSPIYEVDPAQVQLHYNASGQHPFRDAEDGKISDGAIEAGPSVPPIFIPLQQSKQEDYELQIPSTEASFTEATTTSTTTPAPVIIRQRVRGRLGGSGRPHHHDSAIQTRPQGPQDEYVRFSVVNHDSDRAAGQRHRDGLKTRTRARPQTHRSQVQTDGNEYIKIHAVQQQRLTATTTPSTTTATPVVPTGRPVEEDVDYGFIRPPSFRPVNPVHPADSRYQAPITYRPVLSEIQHLIPNDETAVESSQTHVLKNRPKYQQISSRRPITKTIADVTTSTTTEAVPVATTIPDDTARPKVRTKESKPTRIRGRIRRPSKKRPTTTTTESVLEANNELPLDENYPRITAQQLSALGQQQQQQQQPLYDDNFDVSPQFALNENRPSQFYEETGENYPTQEFILNFGNLPEQASQREGYDQTQQASVPSGKYSHSQRVNPSRGDQSAGGDIYGAESQWSTKLSKTSFQPSFASNRVIDERKKGGRGGSRDDRGNESTPEIITAAPEVQSATVIVSSDYQKRTDGADDMDTMMDTTVFGRKTNAQEHRMNMTTTVANSPPTTAPSKTREGSEISLEVHEWMSDKEEDSTGQTDDDKITKKFTESLINRKSGSRRRRVRVRVRPAKEDFVTAESQHFNSAVNNLVEDRYKYDSIRESKFASAQPIATTIATTITTEKSALQGFLEEMLRNDEISIPTRVGTFTTELPDRTASTPIATPITTPYVISDDNDDRVTTAKENYTPIFTTPASISDEERTTIDASTRFSDDSRKAIAPVREYASNASQDEIQAPSEANSNGDENSQVDTTQQDNLEDVGLFTPRYRLPSTYPVSSGTSRGDEDNAAELTEFPTAQGEISKSITVERELLNEKEHIMTLRRQESKSMEENEAHPKNHRAKWSEVKYPSRFDKAQPALRPSSTTSIPGVITRNEGDASVKTLSDYVKAIFDSMKSAEEEEEVTGKVVEAKSDTSANNAGFDDVPVRETSTRSREEAAERTSTTDSSRDAFTTRQPVEIEESTTGPTGAQGTTEESTTIFETTTPITDDTTPIPSGETVTTESPATTFSVKTTTSIGRTTGGGAAVNSTETMLGKVLRTSTTTKVSHMTEICYRGRCVMTKPIMGDATR